MTIRIAPSILSADFANLAEELHRIERGGADLVHLDIMDGHFVPNLTIGPAVVKALRKETRLPFDCHLMVQEPQRFIERFAEAGAGMISVHIEAEPHLHRALEAIRAAGCSAGIAVNPATSAEHLSAAIDFCDFVLLMTVNPGFSGQKFISGVVPKISSVRRMIDERRRSVEIEVDGGIDSTTAASVVAAGATILVAGSAVFGSGDPAGAIHTLRAAATTSLA